MMMSDQERDPNTLSKDDIPQGLEGVAKKDDDLEIDYVDPFGNDHQVRIDRKVLDDLQRAPLNDCNLNLTELDDDGAPLPSLPLVWARGLLEDQEELEPMIVPVEVIYLMYLGNAMFMGGLMLCLGTFWMYVFLLLPRWGHWEWIRYVVTGGTWGVFACLYCMLLWIDTPTVRGTAALILSWQTSAMFAVASLAAFIEHQAPLQVCAIVFLQSMMVVVYTYTQKRDPSASLAFLLMLMVTLLQWSVGTFVFGLRGSLADGHVPAAVVLIAGIAICFYHACHIRYIVVHNDRKYFLADKSRLEALRDLYTDGLRWLAVGVRDVHRRIAQWRHRCAQCCCGRCGRRPRPPAQPPRHTIA